MQDHTSQLHLDKLGGTLDRIRAIRAVLRASRLPSSSASQAIYRLEDVARDIEALAIELKRDQVLAAHIERMGIAA